MICSQKLCVCFAVPNVRAKMNLYEFFYCFIVAFVNFLATRHYLVVQIVEKRIVEGTIETFLKSSFERAKSLDKCKQLFCICPICFS